MHHSHLESLRDESIWLATKQDSTEDSSSERRLGFEDIATFNEPSLDGYRAPVKPSIGVDDGTDRRSVSGYLVRLLGILTKAYKGQVLCMVQAVRSRNWNRMFRDRMAGTY